MEYIVKWDIWIGVKVFWFSSIDIGHGGRVTRLGCGLQETLIERISTVQVLKHAYELE